MSPVVSAQYRCANERRREVVRAAGTLNGIDSLEVAQDQTVLRVLFLRGLPGTGGGAVPAGPALTAANIVIVGGTRVRVRVTEVLAEGDVLTVTVDRPGDFSIYELRLFDPSAPGDVPGGFDTQLASVQFSFKASCPADLDCLPPGCGAPAVVAGPLLDYLAKDYDSFRQLMLDRLAVSLPGSSTPNPADLQVALVELLAYAADRLSYYQDAVATEAYLGTARSRVSVRRHVRLLDYRVHEGCSARAFVHFAASTGLLLPAGTGVQAGPTAGTGVAPVVFETLHPVMVREAHSELAFHTWSDEQCCLPVGATRATLVGGPDVALEAGQFLLLEETEDPVVAGGQADLSHRQVVCLVEVREETDRIDATPVVEVAWAPADALTFALCIGAPGRVTAVARANIALADHGATRRGLALAVEHPAPPGPWRPLVPDGPLAFSVAFDPAAPAAAQLLADPREAVAAIVLADPIASEDWEPVYDLLGAAPTATVFAVEVEEDRTARLRFGDDVSGRRPPEGSAFLATVRVGGGPAGNVGAEALDRLVAATDGVTAVRNPLPAAGGADPEPTEQVRQHAPQVYRTQERAVTAADYAAVADRVSGVERAAAELRWTGSWYTAFVTVDRTGGGSPDDDGLAGEVEDFLDTFRMTGIDVEIDAPVAVPVEVELEVCVAEGFIATQVEGRVLDALQAGRRADGGRGFFHPDNFTFGQPLYLSQLYAAALAVPGVAWARATTFRRFGRPDGGELAAGVMTVGGREIIQMAGDPSFPDRGRLTVTASPEITAGGV